MQDAIKTVFKFKTKSFCWIEANTETKSASIEVFFACRLISLYKNPGSRPVRVWEVKQKIAGKRVIQTCGLHFVKLNKKGTNRKI